MTNILQGDEGLQHLKRVCDYLAPRVLVDDRCSTHIHIGGAHDAGPSYYFRNARDSVPFVRSAIKLATMLEDELFTILPSSRDKTTKHCHSIKGYSIMNEDNWPSLLAHYTFGGRIDNKVAPLFEHRCRNERDLYDQIESTNGRKWRDARYKWLNLLNLVTPRPSTVVEFRLFSPTTDYRTIYNFILLSMAFVKFVDEHVEDIWKTSSNITLLDVITDVYSGPLADTVRRFIYRRQNIFKTKKPTQLITSEVS